MLAELKRLWAHAVWADRELLRALASATEVPPVALREMSHVIGAEETWLSRLEGRPALVSVWPTLSLEELRRLTDSVHAAFDRYFNAATEATLGATVHYTNSAGLSFSNTAIDIVMQVVTHGQYHRGKVNLILRQSGLAPAPTDYIAFVRGVKAATHPPSLDPHS